MSYICTICARGGSKGIPNKNLRVLVNRPMIAFSVQQAIETSLFSQIAVSSDSPEILSAAAAAGATQTILRPASLAQDNSPKLPAIQHCVRTVEKMTGREFPVVVDLDATAPLRTPSDVEGAIAMLEQSGADNVITAALARRSPYFNLVELKKDGFATLSKTMATPPIRRQDVPPAFDMNASIYVWRREALFRSQRVIGDKTAVYVMPHERSIDIDSELDLEIVRFLMERQLLAK